MQLITQDKALQAFNSIKDKIDAATKKLLSIDKITDENVSSVLTIATDSNKILKEIENRRKEMKQPFLDAGKIIDETVKHLSSDLEKAIKEIKISIAEYEAEVKRKHAEEQRRIEEQKQAELDKLNNQAKIIADLYKELDEYLSIAYKSISECKNEQDLKIAYKKYVTDFPEKLKAIPNYQESIDLIKDYGKNHRQIVLAYLSAIDIKDDDEARVLLESMNALYNAKLGNKQEAVETVKEKIIDQLEEKAAEVVASSVVETAIIEKPKTVGREYLEFNVHDKAAIPAEWLTIDESKVKEFMKDHSESLKEKIKLSPTGYIVYGGIMFTLKTSTVLR